MSFARASYECQASMRVERVIPLRQQAWRVMTETRMSPPGPGCPECNSPDTVMNLYGMPTWEIGQMAERGEVELGGCIVFDGQATHVCHNCGARFVTDDPLLDPDLEQQERIRGCLIGGAVGDALGAGIEFSSLTDIRRVYGPEGVTGYVPAFGAPGTVTDDTQMTLFTAEGLIRAQGRDPSEIVASIRDAYLRWYRTQGGWMDVRADAETDGWLITQPVMQQRRAPGNTCLSALKTGGNGSVSNPINDSKGCGGVMRVAPIGLVDLDHFTIARDAAALTHTHPSGYLAAGALAVMIAQLSAGDPMSEAIESGLESLRGRPDADETITALEEAVFLADRVNHRPRQWRASAKVGWRKKRWQSPCTARWRPGTSSRVCCWR